MTRRLAGAPLLGPLLLLLLWRPAVVQAIADTPPEEALARQAFTAQQYARACDLYRKLAKENPTNAEYWIWVGRLSGYMSDFGAALSAYDSALALVPKDIDALVGKAYILLWTHKYEEARVLLDRLREMAPESSDVNLASARQNFYTHHPEQALKYIDDALKADPRNAEALAFREVLAPRGSLWLDLAVTADDLPYAAEGVSGSAEVGWKAAAGSVSLRAEEWSRYGRAVFRGGPQFSRTFKFRWTMEGGLLVASRADVLPRWDGSVALKRKLRGGWVPGLGYRELLFDNAHVGVLSPKLEYYFERPIWLEATYSRSWNSFKALPDNNALGVPANSYFLRYNQRLHRVPFHLGYGQGIQLFASPAADRLGQFKADTFLGGLQLPLADTWTAHVDYVQERRSNGAVEQLVTGGITFKRRHAP